MLKRLLCLLLCLLLVMPSLTLGMTVSASEREDGTGSRPKYVTVTNQRELIDALTEEGGERVFIQIGADIEGEQYYAFGPISVNGYKTVDLNGHKIRSKLFFNDGSENRSLFVIEAGASLTLNDSVGGGEIIHDRFIPAMGETNAYSDIFLSRPLTVFDVYGVLTVNAGEITAGHYESEYYTYTDGYIYADSSPSPGTVNSITPGNAVVVKSGGRFVSNGGEYYGRGFTIDDEGQKDSACAAVKLLRGAEAVIYAGDFYGKSCADVFSVGDRVDLTVYAGNFYARYDNRVTVDKANGVAAYVNVDCGRIGIPLYAFNHEKKDYTHIFIDSTEHYYDFTDYSASDAAVFLNLGSSGTGIDVRVETLTGSGTKASPYRIKYVSDLKTLLRQTGSSKRYLRLEDDLSDFIDTFTVKGDAVLDLNGHTIKERLDFGIALSSDALFSVESGANLTVDDSVGGGEIIFDRRIPSMGETNEQTGIFLDRALTVFNVQGILTVNGGEITAGHYESEYYTYTKKYNTGGSTSAGTVNSITPGNAVVVRDGGRFTSNGGEYYGRGFTIDDNGEKETVCAAVCLCNGAVAIVNAGDFYGKSCADVFSVAWGANVSINFGYFEAQYDNRITVDKLNGTAYYVNVDCGRIGLPLRSFSHTGADRRVIKIGPDQYPFSLDFTTSQSNEFENLGSEGIGADVTVSVQENGASRIVREDGIDAGLTYSPTDHFELINDNAQYYSESFAPLPDDPYHVMSYYWKVTRLGGNGWEDVSYAPGAPVSNNYYLTDTNRLDLYALARDLRGGMTQGSTYRIEAHASEYWKPADEVIYTVSDDVIEIDCVYERIGNISLPDDVTGIIWPEHGKNPVNLSIEQEAFTAAFTFEEQKAGGTRYTPMSERSTFSRGGSYRLKVQITPKPYYRVDAEHSLTVGGKTATELTVSGGVLTGYIVPLDVLPSKILSIPVRGDISVGVELSAASPLNSPISGVKVSTVWYKDGSAYTGTSTPGEYRALVTVTAQDPYVFTDATIVTVMGKMYPITNLSPDGLSGSVLTDPQYVGCDHSKNTNGVTYDSEYHYRICSICGEEFEHAAHTFGNWSHQGGEDVRTCSVCSYQETVSNGRSEVPYIRLTGKTPKIGDTLPVLAICEEDRKYGSMENETEWYIDELNYKNRVSADTVMEDGHVYLAFLKFNVSNGYFFTDDTEVATLDLLASTRENVYGSWNHIEAVLAFTPRAYAAGHFTLAPMVAGQTYGEFLSGFDADIDGVRDALTVAVYQNGSLQAALVYNYASDSWWIASGSVDEFMARPMDPEAEYKLLLTLAETGKYFREEDVRVDNPVAAASFSVAGGNLGCTVTAYYRLCPIEIEAASITLQNNLKENFYIEKESITEGGYTDLHAAFEINGKTVTASQFSEVTSEGKTYYVFSLPDIAPNQMNDTVKVTLHAVKDGKEYVSAPTEYSVAEYCYSMLKKTDDAELRTLLVNLLDYGAAAQHYTGYKTGDLANAKLTEEQRAWGTATDPALTSVKNIAYQAVESPFVVWKGVSLRLGDSITMQFVFTAASTDGITVRFENAGGTMLKEITAEDLTASGGYYIASYSGITAGQMSETVLVTAYNGDTAISNTVSYSIESYAYAKQNDADASLAALVRAMMKYGNAAKTYGK